MFTSTITAINGDIGNKSCVTGGTVITRALPRKSPRKRKSVDESQAETDEKVTN